MSDRKLAMWRAWLPASKVVVVAIGGIGSIYASNVMASIHGGDSQSIHGGDSQSIHGGDSQSIHGGDSQSIHGGDLLSIHGGDGKSIHGGDSQSIHGGDLLSIHGGDGKSIHGGDSQSIHGGDLLSIHGGDGKSIHGGDSQSIHGGDLLSIHGGDGKSIHGGDSQSIHGGDLLVVGSVDAVGRDFVSVLGQTVFADRQDLSGLTVGAPVAVYGTIDRELGGIMNATVVSIAAADRSFLRGTVDSVNPSIGTAIVSGVNVDYTSLLSNGRAPSVGDVVAVQGRMYDRGGLLVAEPK